MTFRGDRQRLEGQVGIAAVVRQARLRPECARDYPSLPVSMWTSARRLAALVATAWGALPPERGKPGWERTLAETDFEFRGGLPHRPVGLPVRSRAGEPAVN